jgi:hypothetical protein
MCIGFSYYSGIKVQLVRSHGCKPILTVSLGDMRYQPNLTFRLQAWATCGVRAPDHTKELGLYDPALTHAPSIGKPLPQQSYQGSTLIPCPINWFCVVLIFEENRLSQFQFFKENCRFFRCQFEPSYPCMVPWCGWFTLAWELANYKKIHRLLLQVQVYFLHGCYFLVIS